MIILLITTLVAQIITRFNNIINLKNYLFSNLSNNSSNNLFNNLFNNFNKSKIIRSYSIKVKFDRDSNNEADRLLIINFKDKDINFYFSSAEIFINIKRIAKENSLIIFDFSECF